MTRVKLLPGDAVPYFSCRTPVKDAFHFDTVAGRFVVLSLLGSSTNPNAEAWLKRVRSDLKKHFNNDHVCFFGVTADAADAQNPTVKNDPAGIRFFWDFDKQVSQKLGALNSDGTGEYEIFTLLLDPQLRVLGRVSMQDSEKHNAALQKMLENLPPINQHAGVKIHAPVLIVPRVFEPSFCRELIALYQANETYDSGFMRQIGDKTVGVLDHSFKCRRDFTFETGSEFEGWREQIRARLSRRLIPEIKRAFQYQVTRIERFIVSRYEAEGGSFFRAHRDNTTTGTAHRKFACSINLNAEEYEGGDLRFPEFGSYTYRAPTGGAVVFSCSLLHEATPVTEGERFAFLPFFYDEEGAKIRSENAKFVDNAGLASPKN